MMWSESVLKLCEGPKCWVRGVCAKLPTYSSTHSGRCHALVSYTQLCGPSARLGSWSDALQSVIREQELRFKKDDPTSLLYFGNT